MTESETWNKENLAKLSTGRGSKGGRNKENTHEIHRLVYKFLDANPFGTSSNGTVSKISMGPGASLPQFHKIYSKAYEKESVNFDFHASAKKEKQPSQLV